MGTKSNLMAKIIISASFVVIVAFAGFSFYIDSLQRNAANSFVSDKIHATGKQASLSIANWLNGRITMTEMVASTLSQG